jgi:CRP-like cAMP-binding protein
LVFETVSIRFPDLRRNVHHILQRRLDELERRIYVVSTRTASPRLANGIAQLMEQLGKNVNSHIEINVAQETLAQMTAMSSFQVCHLLNLWKAQGIVRLRKEFVEIHNVSRLMDLCKVR